jgi:2-keto-3-deoxy-L-rhamnonate aldolase RhmA
VPSLSSDPIDRGRMRLKSQTETGRQGGGERLEFGPHYACDDSNHGLVSVSLRAPARSVGLPIECEGRDLLDVYLGQLKKEGDPDGSEPAGSGRPRQVLEYETLSSSRRSPAVQTESASPAMSTTMRTHPIGDRLIRDGSATIGVTISNFYSPRIFQILAAAGADYGLIDLEHTSFSCREVEAMVAGAKGTELPVIVRPPEVARAEIGRILDLGADGILAPRVGTREDAKAAVGYSKYGPIGDRGAEYGHVAGGRTALDAINQGTLLIALVETAEAVENIDAICSTPGMDAVWVGPVDLSLSLGVAGDFESEIYRNAEDRLIASCRAYGIPFAIGAVSTPEAAIAQVTMGCFTLLMDDEVTLFKRAVSSFLSDVQAGLQRRRTSQLADKP